MILLCHPFYVRDVRDVIDSCTVIFGRRYAYCYVHKEKGVSRKQQYKIPDIYDIYDGYRYMAI